MMYIRLVASLILIVCPCIIFGVTQRGRYFYNESVAYPELSPSLGLPWPMPQQMLPSSTYMLINPKQFNIILNRPKCDVLQKAIDRITKLTFLNDCNLKQPTGADTRKEKSNKTQKEIEEAVSLIESPLFKGVLYNLTINVQNECEDYPYMNMDEMYILRINTDDIPAGALIFSMSVWGAIRGLETFSQLVYQVSSGMFAVNSTTIIDFPRFSHRGLLLDTSRHFVPMHVLYENLEAMAQNKMNVFHWHIVDDQSFPYTSTKFPDMTKMGSFNPDTHVYSVKDVASIIEFARVRGIRVLAEFDTPGHTLSWGKGQPNLLTPCFNGNVTDGQFGPINPAPEETYSFLKDFFQEVSDVFPDGYVHLGGDEVSFACWQSNPDITEFMKQKGFPGDYAKLEEYYMSRLLDIMQQLNKSYIIWQEVVDNGVTVKPDTVVHVWKDGYQAEMSTVTKLGYHTLLSACWYLNYISYGDDWKKYYQCDPQDFDGTPEQKQLVLGGEACMWGEYVDGSNLITRTWPRTSAVAERLWSSADLTDPAAAVGRLEEHRCRMMKRGLRVEPINGPSYCPCDHLL